MLKRLVCLIACLAMVLPVAMASAADQPKAQSVPADLARLIPDEAVMIAYTGSMNALTKSATDLVSSINPQMAMMVAFAGPKAMLSQQISTQNKMLDDGAVAYVMWPGETLQDVPYWAVIFGVEDASPKTVRAKGRGKRLIFLEGTNWVALTNAQKSWEPKSADASTTTLVKGLLPGEVAVGFDLERFVADHKDELRRQLQEQVAEADLGDAGSHMALTAGHTVLFTTRRWDLGLGMDGGDVGLTVQYLPKDDSPMAIKGSPDVQALSQRLPAKLPLQMVADGEFMRSFIDGMLKNQLSGKGIDRDTMRTLMTNVNAICEDTDGGMGASFGFSEHGPNLVKVFKVKDVQKMFELADSYIDEANKADMGMQFEQIPVLIGGDSSRAYRIKIDMIDQDPSMKDAHPFGPDGLILRLISNKNMMAAVIGDPKLLGRTRRALEQASSTDTVIDSIAGAMGGQLVMAWSLDIRAMAFGVQKWVKTNADAMGRQAMMLMPITTMKMEEAPPIMVQMGIATQGDPVKFHLNADVAKAYAFFNSITEQMEPPAARTQPTGADGGS